MKRIGVPSDFFDDCDPGDRVALPNEQAHYVRDVLRFGEGAELELFDGEGTLASAVITDAGDDVVVELMEFNETEQGESPIRCVLFQAIPKGKRWKWILEKSTELGVDTIVPLETKHTIVQIPEDRLERRLERWERIVTSAARQCERTVVPTVCRPMAPQKARTESTRDVDLVAHPGPGARTPRQVLDETGEIRSVGIWIGPEGGFTEDEVEALIAAGMHRIGLGPRVLRADTAPITALTLVQAARGDLDVAPTPR